jgi:choline kinase
MKAIILGAGRGRRLMPATERLPKCLLPVVNGRRILDTVLETFRESGITEIVFVGGYRIHDVQRAFPSLTYVYNHAWDTTNILQSLLAARAHIAGPVLLSYSDITYGAATVAGLLTEPADMTLVVDPHWRDGYTNRTHHPENEAEKVIVRSGTVADIGKRVPGSAATGEFIGLARLSEAGAALVRSISEMLIHTPDSESFHDAVRLADAYLTDMVKELIANGARVRAVPVVGPWAEFDTFQDTLLGEARLTPARRTGIDTAALRANQ